MKTAVLLALLVVGLVTITLLVRQENAQAQEGSHSPRPPAGKQAGEFFDDPVARAKADIEELGWHIVMVKGEGTAGFLYTIGLWETYKHPEILIFAPSQDPTGMAQRLAAIAERVTTGETFQSGKTFGNLFGNHSGAIRDVLPVWIPSFMGVAHSFYEDLDFPVIQLYWPDKRGLFPWQSGFNPDLFAYQPILDERNVILANVGIEVAQEATKNEKPRALEAALEELLFEPESIAGGDILENWRWRLGPEPQLFRMTLFGDLFLRTANGHIYWLDTGSNIYEEIATSQDAWRHIIFANPGAFFHASTLLQFRSLDFLPEKGQVYSWILPPISGGQDAADNFDIVSAAVHLLHSGKTARNAQETRPPAQDADDDNTIYTVVINSEEQYSMWPAEEEIPAGWRDAGKTGTKQECLDFIEKVWVDMRPKSLQQKMEQDSQENQQ